MASKADDNGGRRANPWRVALWSLAGLALLVPLVAMRFTGEVNWTAGDFIFAALLLGVVGLALELAVRTSLSLAYRAGVGLALAAGVVIVWANGAVGMIGNEDDPYNLLFLAVIALALLGAAIARFRPAGMAKAMAAAGLAQAAIAAGGMAQDLRGAVFSIGLAFLWALSAILFRNAALKPGQAS